MVGLTSVKADPPIAEVMPRYSAHWSKLRGTSVRFSGVCRLLLTHQDCYNQVYMLQSAVSGGSPTIMTTQATGTYAIASWDETPFSEVEDAPKLSRASVTTTFHGDIEGAGTLEYLLMYGATA